MLFTITTKAQEEQKYEISGYISNMQSVMFDSLQGMWMLDNLVHNRLNFNWYPARGLSGSLQLRNRLMMGNSLANPGYAQRIDNDRGFVDMSWNIFEEQSVLLNANIDRLWFNYEKDKLNIRLGRQRINWAQTMVWNPNDIFNSYSFFDFDYPEKPGSDALRIQYYPSFTSTLEAVAKIDKDENITAAGRYKFNKWGYDIQLVGGYMNSSDYVAGLGWSGNLKGAALRGEMSYFHPRKHFEDTTGLFFASVSGDYIFDNSLMLQAEYFYCQIPKNQDINNFHQFYNAPLTVKNLSFTEHNIFAQASYPITPLFKVTFSGMYFPTIDGFAVIPTISYSLKQNLELKFVNQAFSGKFLSDDRQQIVFAFLRLKSNF